MRRFFNRRFAVLAILLVGAIAIAQQEIKAIQSNGSTAVRPWVVQGSATGTPIPIEVTVDTSNPASTSTNLTGSGVACTAAGGASCTIIYASTEWIAWPNLTITIRNSDASDTIENVLVEWSPDNSNWEVWDSTTFASLTAGTIKSLAISGNSRRYLRIEARASADSSTEVHITANTGG